MLPFYQASETSKPSIFTVNFQKVLMFEHLSYTQFIQTLRKTTEKGEKGFINTENLEKFS